ncbi:DnaD domain protein [Niallia sp. 01092]|uniref:DnaD domain protein n=1 Tax=unclassified Niallia TaxID=2837522 RepID=UPI003FD3FE68
MVERHDKSVVSNKKKKDKEIKHDKENNNKIKKENEVVMVEQNPFLEYEKSFGFPSPMLIEEFNFWIDNDKSFFQEPEAIICEVIKEARKHVPNNPPSYVKAIIKKYHDMQLFTLADVQAYNRKFEEKRTGKAKRSIFEQGEESKKRQAAIQFTEEDKQRLIEEIQNDPDLI